MNRVNFGTAHLFVADMPASRAQALLEAAVAAGVGRLDTAPLYGHGRSEALVATVAAACAGVRVTTKVGHEPSAQPSALRRAAGTFARALPPRVTASLRNALRRGQTSSQSSGPSGRFGLPAVRSSIERSLARLGHLDRLLLHEVHPADITDDLLGLLEGYVARGDVQTLGVATGNAVTLQALERGQGLLGVAHVSIDPLDIPFAGAATMPGVRFVGHGALGPGGRTLKALQQRIETDVDFARDWHESVRGSDHAGADGPARALIANARANFSGELLVATGRVDRVAETVAAAAGRDERPPRLVALLDHALQPAHPWLRRSQAWSQHLMSR